VISVRNLIGVICVGTWQKIQASLRFTTECTPVNIASLLVFDAFMCYIVRRRVLLLENVSADMTSSLAGCIREGH